MIGHLINTGRGIGFDYDQVTEPSNPSVGQLWRERNGSGLVVGDWEWNGAIWWSSLTELGSAIVTNLASTNVGTLTGSVEIPSGKSIWIELTCRYYLTSADATTNFWTITPQRRAESGTTTTTTFASNSIPLTSGLAAWREAFDARLTTSVSAGREFVIAVAALRTGAPGNLTATFLVKYRRIR